MSGRLAFAERPSRTSIRRARPALELLAAARRLANFCHMRLKQALASRRPNEYSAQVSRSS